MCMTLILSGREAGRCYRPASESTVGAGNAAPSVRWLVKEISRFNMAVYVEKKHKESGLFQARVTMYLGT